MRADARRNHARLMDAARDVFVERGPDAPLEEIARRASVGIATLYRRFPDRATLIHALVLSALTATAAAAEGAGREHADPFDALTAYVHAVLDLRTSAVIATLLDVLDLDEPEIKAARDASARLAEDLVTAARDSGALRKDATFGDVGIMLTRLSRPLPGTIPLEVQSGLAHRHADVFLAGLRADPSGPPPGGPALDRADLQRLRRDRAEPGPDGP
jgi:AcrR family transcriptional regulator